MRGVRYSFIGISVWSASYYTCVMWSMKKAGVSGYFLGRVYRNVLPPGSTIGISYGIHYQDFLSGFTIALICHSLDP